MSRIPGGQEAGRRGARLRRLAGSKTRALLLGGIALVLLAVWARLTPLDPLLLDRTRHASVTVTDRNGEVLYESLAQSGARAEWLTAGTLPPKVVAATLAAEDRRFVLHPGVDPIAVARAAVHNLKALRVVQGGSTITQQVAKLLLQSKSRSLKDKAREALVALRLEHRYSKDEILALYLNLAPYGNRIHGVARASRAYFGCAPEQLTAAQAAFLASLPQRPSAFNPLRDPAAARARQQRILARMDLPPEELQRARREELRFTRSSQPVLAMHFVERVLRESNSRRIVTSLDARLQRTVLGVVAAQRASLVAHGAHAVAVAVLDNRTGEWLAWEGSGDYFGEGFGGAIDGVTTPRQPGSTLKPFTYALAFESGRTPASVLPDVPSHFPTGEDGVVYTPRNYDGRYRGPLRVRAALAGSENVPAVAMLHELGSESLLRLLRNAGFSGLDRTATYYGLGLTLGNAEVTLEQLVRAYAMFARGGKPLAAGRGGADRALVSARTAFWISDILSDSTAREYAFGSGGSLDFPFPVAVKTGTSQAYRDNWTIGYTRDVTVGVWVGNFDREPLRGSSGVTGAAPIFNAVMLAAVKHVRGELPIGDATPLVAPPPDVERVEICALSGARPSTWCPAIQKEWLRTDQPARFCSWHHDGAIDWPATYRAWARTAQAAPVRQATRHASVFRIANPPDGATYLIDPTLRSEFQTLRFRADAASRVSWRVDGRPVQTAEWSLVPGEHTVAAIDERGRRDEVRIVVK